MLKSSCEHDLIQKQGPCKHNAVMVRSWWSRVGPTPVTGALTRKETQVHTQTGGGPGDSVGHGAYNPGSAKDCWEEPEASRGGQTLP